MPENAEFRLFSARYFFRMIAKGLSSGCLVICALMNSAHLWFDYESPSSMNVSPVYMSVTCFAFRMSLKIKSIFS